LHTGRHAWWYERSVAGRAQANGQVKFRPARFEHHLRRQRIEQAFRNGDNVRRGEPIVALYSPDMTAEEYPARQTTHLSGAGMAGTRFDEFWPSASWAFGMERADIRAISSQSDGLTGALGGTVIENKATRGGGRSVRRALYAGTSTCLDNR
jgi:hypothetical protein